MIPAPRNKSIGNVKFDILASPFSFLDVKYTANNAIMIPINLQIPMFSLKINIPKSIGIIIDILLATEATEILFICVVFAKTLKTQINIMPKNIAPNIHGAESDLEIEKLTGFIK
jgi:hypothetical protein